MDYRFYLHNDAGLVRLPAAGVIHELLTQQGWVRWPGLDQDRIARITDEQAEKRAGDRLYAERSDEVLDREDGGA